MRFVITSKDQPAQAFAALVRVRELIGSSVPIYLIYEASSSFLNSLYLRVATDCPFAKCLKAEECCRSTNNRWHDSEDLTLLLSDDYYLKERIDLNLVEEVLRSNPQVIGFCVGLNELRHPLPPPDKGALLQLSGSAVKVRAMTWDSSPHDKPIELQTAACVYRTPLIDQAFTGASTIAGFLAKLQRLAFPTGRAPFAYFRLDQSAITKWPAPNPPATHWLTATTTCRVSVIIPCYKQAHYLRESVGSVLMQDFQDWECLIINDGSPDETQAVAADLIKLDPRGRVRLISKTNGGLSDARNVGFAMSRGEFILPLDADDRLMPNALSTLLEAAAADPSAGIYYPDYFSFGVSNAHIRCVDETEYKNPLRKDSGMSYFSLFRRSTWTKVGGYDPIMRWGYEDWNFSLSCLAAGITARHVHAPTTQYRTKTESMLTEALQRDQELRSQLVLNHRALYSKERIKEALTVGGVYRRSNPPLVSVIVPTFNRPERLREALESIKVQTFEDFEIIVVNDAGEDIPDEILQIDPRIKYVRSPVNQGLSATRRLGVQSSAGRYISYLDDDDRFYRHHLQTLVSTLESSRAEVVYADSARAWERSRDGKRQIWKRDLPYSNDYDGQEIFLRNITPVLTVMHTRAIYDRAGGWSQTLRRLEDWDLWLRMAALADFKHVPEVTSEFTWHESGTSMTSAWRGSFHWVELNVLWSHRSAIRTRLKQPGRFLHRLDELLLDLTRSLEQPPYYASPEDLANRLCSNSLGEASALFRQIAIEHPDFGAKCEVIDQLLKNPRPPIKRRSAQPTGQLTDPNPNRTPGLVSVVVPLFNAWSYTAAMLPAFFESVAGLPVELIIVDNGSTDETRRKLEAWRGRARIILNEVNKNFAGACNQGAAAARGEFILFLNNDVLFTPGWLGAMINALRSDPKVAIVGNRQLYGDRRTVHHCGMYFHPEGNPDHHLRGVDKADQRTLIRRRVNCVTGSCLLIRAKSFFQSGGFDENFINGYEDVDLCLSVRARGEEIEYAPDSEIVHFASKSPRRRSQHERNFEYFMEKWGGRTPDDRRMFELQDEPLVQEFYNRIPLKPRIGIILLDGGGWFMRRYAVALAQTLRDESEAVATIDVDTYLFLPRGQEQDLLEDLWVRSVGDPSRLSSDILTKELKQSRISTLIIIDDRAQSGGPLNPESLERLTASLGIKTILCNASPHQLFPPAPTSATPRSMHPPISRQMSEPLSTEDAIQQTGVGGAPFQLLLLGDCRSGNSESTIRAAMCLKPGKPWIAIGFFGPSADTAIPNLQQAIARHLPGQQLIIFDIFGIYSKLQSLLTLAEAVIVADCPEIPMLPEILAAARYAEISGHRAAGVLTRTGPSAQSFELLSLNQWFLAQSRHYAGKVGEWIIQQTSAPTQFVGGVSGLKLVPISPPHTSLLG